MAGVKPDALLHRQQSHAHALVKRDGGVAEARRAIDEGRESVQRVGRVGGRGHGEFCPGEWASAATLSHAGNRRATLQCWRTARSRVLRVAGPSAYRVPAAVLPAAVLPRWARDGAE